MVKVTDYLNKFTSDNSITKAQHESTTLDIEKRLAELETKSQSRLALIKTSISQLRTNVTENLKAIKSPAYSSNPAPNVASYSTSMSSIEVGLRTLNKVRKNNIVFEFGDRLPVEPLLCLCVG